MVGNACPVIRRDGQPCQGAPGPSGRCWAHDPGIEERRREARKKGGEGKSRKVRAQKFLPRDLEILDGVLDQAIARTYQGGITPSQGSAIAALAGAKVRLREISLKLAEQTEFKERIQKLEERLNDINLKANRNGTGSRRY
jgi:hypothetical protein